MAGDVPWTPGPWSFCKGRRAPNPCSCGYVFGHGGEVYVAKSLNLGDDVDPVASEEARSANARLIAAAPEMAEEIADNLDTLEKLRADLASVDVALHAQRIGVLDIHIERQRALLSRIRGEAS